MRPYRKSYTKSLRKDLGHGEEKKNGFIPIPEKIENEEDSKLDPDLRENTKKKQVCGRRSL